MNISEIKEATPILHYNGYEIKLGERPNNLKELKEYIKKKCFLKDEQLEKMMLTYKDEDDSIMPLEDESDFSSPECMVSKDFYLELSFARKQKEEKTKEEYEKETQRVIEEKIKAFDTENILKKFKEILEKKFKEIIEKKKLMNRILYLILLQKIYLWQKKD